MIVPLVVAGAIWGGWLGRREAAHAGVGIGFYGLCGGAILGWLIGFGVSVLPLLAAVVAVAVLTAGTLEVVNRY